jgi:hypothetical protein
MNFKRAIGMSLFAVGSFCGAFFGCSSVVKHPESDQIKRIAILSLTTSGIFRDLDRDSRDRSGLGPNRVTGTRAAFNELVKPVLGPDAVRARKEQQESRQRIAQFALEKFVENFKKVPGWEVVSAEPILNSAEYHELVQMENAEKPFLTPHFIAQVLDHAPYSSPSRMGATPFVGCPLPAAKKELLLKLLAELRVDALAWIDLDIGYKRQSVVTFTGSGFANGFVSTSVQVINAEGDIAISFPEAINGTYFKTDHPAAMMDGDWLPNAEVETELHSAIDKSANDCLGKIIMEIRK